jgi:hypothetical protein
MTTYEQLTVPDPRRERRLSRRSQASLPFRRHEALQLYGLVLHHSDLVRRLLHTDVFDHEEPAAIE